MVDNNALPPQNIEAEESILGGILLDRDAMGRVVDLITPNAFYVPVHKEIYEAALKLYAQGKPVDLLTIKTVLEDYQLLEKVGGIDKLMQLLDRTVSAVNIDRYGVLIMEKYLRRQLISSGHEIVELGFETTKELDQILDESEKKIFRLTQKRPQEGLIPIADTLVQTYSELEKRHQKTSLPGIQTDFYDLDAMTGGLQRSDLIIIAGRPSMGKCLAANSEIVLADGSLATIEEIYHRRQGQLLTLHQDWKFRITNPSDFIDDGIKPVFKVTTKLGRYIETTLTHPYLTIKGWQQLSQLKPGDKIAIPRKIDIFGTRILPKHQVKTLAYLIGGGCLTQNYPLFTNNNPWLQKDFIQSVTNFKGVKVKRQISRLTKKQSFFIVDNLGLIRSNRTISTGFLKKIIRSNKFSYQKLVHLLNVNYSFIQNCKQGKCVSNQQTFEQLHRVLPVDSKKLVCYETAIIGNNDNNSLKIWLQELGLWGRDSYNKIIPSIIFELQPQLLSLFLNRLFATSGLIFIHKNGQIQLMYCSVSLSLIRQIQHLLLRFGIISSLKKQPLKHNIYNKIIWEIDINDAQSIKIFFEKIRIFGNEKLIDLDKKTLLKQQFKINCDLIKKEFSQQIDFSAESRFWTGIKKRTEIKNYDDLYLCKQVLSRNKTLRSAISSGDLSLNPLMTSEVYWDEISLIEYVGERQVYDLTIPETHNFIANDICVHNTAFGLAMAANIAKNSKLPIAIFSLEMSKEQLSLRLLAAESKIEGNRLRTGRFVQNEYEQLSLALGNLSEMPIYIDDAANITVMQIRSQIRRLKAEQKGDLGLVLIDYLQLMEGGGSENRTQELSKITRSLKGLAREVNVPVVALSQLSRAVETRNNKRPMMSDLRESGAIEQDADLIMMLYRDEYYNTDTVDRGIAEIIITKHRNGPTGPIKLLFQPEFTQFLNMQNDYNR
ncbi:replicative DNA helicase [Cyanobacterium sp. uoEpiScrs1]|uniref:replicative DNA helicase n=1 Tax=Cyanobacterium sp. uoEpiScrs1 TaxID=2976343 RepID=UPI002269A768|nr:replicative DNA helicase [Cyanobacterium sp. uoEpiScrs1]